MGIYDRQLKELDSQFEELLSLRNGWLDGEGKKPSEKSKEIYKIFRKVIEDNYCNEKFYLFPCAHGGLTLEMTQSVLETIIDIEPDGTITGSCLDNLQDDICLNRSLKASEVNEETLKKMLQELYILNTGTDDDFEDEVTNEICC